MRTQHCGKIAGKRLEAGICNLDPSPRPSPVRQRAVGDEIEKKVLSNRNIPGNANGLIFHFECELAELNTVLLEARFQPQVFQRRQLDLVGGA